MRAKSQGNAACHHDALLFTIDAMDQPIDGLMEAAGVRSGSKRCSDRGSVATAAAGRRIEPGDIMYVWAIHTGFNVGTSSAHELQTSSLRQTRPPA